jgi:hypothetical protein
MPLTRSQILKLKETLQLHEIQQSQSHINTNIHKSSNHSYNIYNIDFIDASIEWRKNKIKKDNCTFEYITPHL